MTTEAVPLGRTSCHFLTRDDYLNQCRAWLQSDHVHHIVTLNPEMVMLAEHDDAFAAALNQAELRVPDGAGLIWARWYIRSAFWSLWPSLIAFPFIDAERITGVDTVLRIARLCAEQQQTLYLLGGTSPQRTRTAEVLRRQFPALTVVTSPDHHYEPDGPGSIIEHINQHHPAVLLVAYGAPKQTLWIERHRHQLPHVKIASGVGGAFAMLSEERPRAPYVFQRFNLEWLWRLILEPSRFGRIWQATVRFPLLIHRYKQTVTTTPSQSVERTK